MEGHWPLTHVQLPAAKKAGSVSAFVDVRCTWVFPAPCDEVRGYGEKN